MAELVGSIVILVLPVWILWDSKTRLGRVWIGLVWAVVAFVVYSTYFAALIDFVFPDWPRRWYLGIIKFWLLVGGAYAFFNLYKFFTQEAAARHAALAAAAKDGDVAKVEVE